MARYGEALERWRAIDAAGLEPLPPAVAGAFVGVPLRVGRWLAAWSAPDGGAVQFLPGSNGPGGLAHGGAVLALFVDACAALGDLDARRLDLALKRPVPLLETLRISLEALPMGDCRVQLSSSNGDALATSTVRGVTLSTRRSDAAIAAIEYGELGELVAMAPAKLDAPAWLIDLRARGVEVNEDMRRNPWREGGPCVSFLDGRAEMEVWAVDRMVISGVVFGKASEGKPGCAHVGAAGAALDSSFVCLCHKVLGDVAMSAAVAATASFEFQVLRDIPLDVTLRLDTTLVCIESRNGKHKVFMKAALRSGEMLLATATTLFIAKGALGRSFVQAAL